LLIKAKTSDVLTGRNLLVTYCHVTRYSSVWKEAVPLARVRHSTHCQMI